VGKVAQNAKLYTSENSFKPHLIFSYNVPVCFFGGGGILSFVTSEYVTNSVPPEEDAEILSPQVINL
jgi:hypothetical protein